MKAEQNKKGTHIETIAKVVWMVYIIPALMILRLVFGMKTNTIYSKQPPSVWEVIALQSFCFLFATSTYIIIAQIIHQLIV